MIIRNPKDKTGKTDIESNKVILSLSNGSKITLEESQDGKVLAITAPGQLLQFGVVNNAILIKVEEGEVIL